jgi:broad specificity phosphatase PhoE
MASIYLIRHGQASFGSDNYDRLSELGCRQASMLGAYFKSTGVAFDAAYSGDLERQRKTAALVLKEQGRAVSHHIDPRFNEIDNDQQMQHLLQPAVADRPDLQDLLANGLRASKDYQKVLEAVFSLWVSPGFEHPELQSWQAYSSAARAALQAVMAEQGSGKTVAVFTSGGTIATLVAGVLGLASDKVYAFYEPLLNCSVSHLIYSRDRISLSSFNDTSALSLLGSHRAESLLSYR